MIIDASAALSQILPGQRSSASDTFFTHTAGPFFSPDVFVWEFANNLLRAERRGALKPEESDGALTNWAKVINVVPSAGSSGLIAVSRAERLSLFDSAYLELAERRAAPLITRDGPLVQAARRRGLTVHDLR